MSNFYKVILNSSEETQSQLSNPVKTLLDLSNKKSSFSINNSLNAVYIEFDQCLNKSKRLLNKIVSAIITPFEAYLNEYSQKHNDYITRITSIETRIKQAKTVLDEAQLTYFNKSYQISQFGSPKKIIPGINTMSDENGEKQLKNKGDVYNCEQIYKYEVVRYNKKASEYSEEYSNILIGIKDNEIQRINFIQMSMNQFMSIMTDYMSVINSFKQMLSSFFAKEICDNEMNEIAKNINSFLITRNNTQQRIPFERFTSFSEYSKTQEVTEKTFTSSSIKAETPIVSFTEEEEKALINRAIDGLLNESDITLDVLADLIEGMKSSDYISKKFLDSILEKKTIFSVQFSNLNNLIHLSDIISFITFFKKDNNNSTRLEINFTIVFIAERVYYYNKENYSKVYLSALLSRNKYFRTKFFWRSFLELKLANKLDDHILRLKKVPQKPIKDKRSLMTKIGGAIWKSDSKSGSLIGQSRILSLLKNYDKLEDDKVGMIDKLASVEMTNLIKDCIPNFANFNCNSEELLDLIAELSNTYKIPKEMIHFYVTYYNVSIHTIRKQLPNKRSLSNTATPFKVKGIDFTLFILKPALSYISKEDTLNLLLLSKKCKSSFSVKLYKRILKKTNLEVKVRLRIWNILLNTNDLKKKYDYKEFIDSTETMNEKTRTEIEKDIHRTFIGIGNSEETKAKLSKILKAVAQCNGNMAYCQGMNYIVEMIYEMTESEEETFFIFLGFFFSTEYPLIYEKDLQKLKSFFYVFNRLISLFEPEIYSYLLSNSLDVHAFSPSWFITLFVSARPYVKGSGLPKVIIRILDRFIISGWKSIIKVSINLLHLFETKLMELRSEALLHFVINDMIKSEFFNNENIELFEKGYSNTSIPRSLITNIEDELNLDSKFRERSNSK